MSNLQWDTYIANYTLQESDAYMDADKIHRALVRNGYTTLELITVEEFLQGMGRPAYPSRRNTTYYNQQGQQVDPMSLYNVQSGLAPTYHDANVSSHLVSSCRNQNSRQARDVDAVFTPQVGPVAPYISPYASLPAYQSLPTGISNYSDSWEASGHQISHHAQRIHPSNEQAQVVESYYCSDGASAGIRSNYQAARSPSIAHYNYPSATSAGPALAYSDFYSHDASRNQNFQQEHINIPSLEARTGDNYRSSGVPIPGKRWDLVADRFTITAYHANLSLWETWTQLMKYGYSVTFWEVLNSLHAQGVSVADFQG